MSRSLRSAALVAFFGCVAWLTAAEAVTRHRQAASDGGSVRPHGVAVPMRTAATTSLPTLTLDDAEVLEGDEETRSIAFSVRLSEPAPAGGVSFLTSATNGTATTGSDFELEQEYVTIPSTATAGTIFVRVFGDTDIEGDEAFGIFVRPDTVYGATIADGEATGTILNDDQILTPISVVQGGEAMSPIAGQRVYIRGIVTGMRADGYFVETPEGRDDGDPMTSEGIFVATSGPPPGDLQPGSLVQVEGIVGEFATGVAPAARTRTELVDAEALLLRIESRPFGTDIPNGIPNATGPLDQLERFESMVVRPYTSIVVEPTRGIVDETNAFATSTGLFSVVAGNTPRPLREPGIPAPDPAPGNSSIPPIPRFDANPEIVAVDSNAFGAGVLDVASRDTVNGLVGVLDDRGRQYTVQLLPNSYPSVAPGYIGSQRTRVPTADQFTIAAFNVDRFFDATDDPTIAEPVLTGVAFAGRVHKLSLTVRDYLNTPDILGLMEVENLATLQRVADTINADAVASGAPDPQYVAYLQEGNDRDGIDVGLLVRTRSVGAGVPRVEVTAVTQVGRTATFVDPSGVTSLLNDRPPLQLDAVVHFDDGRVFPVTAIAVHQRPLAGADADTADGARVRMKRQRQAEFIAQHVQALQANPRRRIMVFGDFNAFQFNDGLAHVMATTVGQPFADDTTVVPGDGTDLVEPDLVNLSFEEATDNRYSSVLDGSAVGLQHFLVNQAMRTLTETFGMDHARINADVPETARNDFNTARRLSRHDPAVVFVKAPPRRFADLWMEADANRDNAKPGDTLNFDVTMTNNGPDAALYPGAGFAFDAELPDLEVSNDDRWNCDTPVIEAGGTTVACAAASMSRPVRFSLVAKVPLQFPPGAITLSASASSETTDREPENDNVTVAVPIDATADLGITLAGPRRLLRTTVPQKLTARLVNRGPTAAPAARVTLKSDAFKTYMALAPPSGWDCVVSPARRFEATCATADLLAPGAEAIFRMQVVTAGRLAPIAFTLSGATGSAADDPDTANNRASKRFSIGGIR